MAAPSLPLPSVDALRDLLDKYTRIRELRDARHDVPPRDELAALARAHPGALRELDRLPPSALERRIDELRETLGYRAPCPQGAEPAERLSHGPVAPGPIALWMTVMARYHSLMRGALAVRARGPRQIGRHGTNLPAPGSPEGGTVEGSHGAMGEPPSLGPSRDAGLWSEDEGPVWNPPRGRLVALVLERLARESGMTIEELRYVLFVEHPKPGP